MSLAAIGSFFGSSNIPMYFLVGVVALYGYMRINWLKADNERLETENQQVIEEFNTLKNTVTNDLEAQRKINDRVRQVNTENRIRLNELYDTFRYSADGSERDIEEIAIAKPTLLQRKINNATNEVGEKITRLSDFSNDDRAD